MAVLVEGISVIVRVAVGAEPTPRSFDVEEAKDGTIFAAAFVVRMAWRPFPI